MSSNELGHFLLWQQLCSGLNACSCLVCPTSENRLPFFINKLTLHYTTGQHADLGCKNTHLQCYRNPVLFQGCVTDLTIKGKQERNEVWLTALHQHFSVIMDSWFFVSLEASSTSK